jgi:hypothetical protein
VSFHSQYQLRGAVMIDFQKVDWSALPEPEDDGAAAHLVGMRQWRDPSQAPHGDCAGR